MNTKADALRAHIIITHENFLFGLGGSPGQADSFIRSVRKLARMENSTFEETLSDLRIRTALAMDHN